MCKTWIIKIISRNFRLSEDIYFLKSRSRSWHSLFGTYYIYLYYTYIYVYERTAYVWLMDPVSFTLSLHRLLRPHPHGPIGPDGSTVLCSFTNMGRPVDRQPRAAGWFSLMYEIVKSVVYANVPCAVACCCIRCI